MLETERRTAISTSQLGLYSDHVDRSIRNRYSIITRKIAIGVMVVAAAILVGIFLYDFTSATSVNSKLNQETKHIYILQNGLRKPTTFTKRFSDTAASPEVNRSIPVSIQDRSDNDSYRNSFLYEEPRKVPDAEFRSQNLNNFKLRRRILKSAENNVVEGPEGKHSFDNHALVHRLRRRHRYPDSDEHEGSEESRPTPFHWELKTPQPTAFKRPRYPQLTQYRYPYASRSIQDIIKYLTNDADLPNRGIKFSGVYVNPKKYDLLPEVGEMVSNSDRSEEDASSVYPFNEDPFYQYKPKHPADVNLLATSNVRFSPTGLHRYNYDYGRPSFYYKPTSVEAQYENPASHANTYGKRRKPQPFSVMLDIYPITDVMDKNRKGGKPAQVPVGDYELRRPIQYNRGPKFYAAPPQTLTGVPNQGMSEEEERQQMIFHLNLYPRKKNKMSRQDIIHRSENMAAEERQQFVDSVWSPLQTIATHLAVEKSKLLDNGEPDVAATRYQEASLDNAGEGKTFLRNNVSSGSDYDDNDDNPRETVAVPLNHKSSVEEDYASTEKYELDAQKNVETTTERESDDCEITTIPGKIELWESKIVDSSKDVDSVEGFQKFSESVSK